MKLILDHKITTTLLIGLILRIISIYFFRDIEIVNEWGIIVKNLEENNILSVHSVQGVPVPNIFMPPLYPLFLYSIKTFFNNTDIFLLIIYFIQLLFALISIYLAYKIFLEFYSENVSFIGSLFFSIFPLNVYAVSQISSIVLQMFLFNLFILSFLKLFKNIDYKYLIIFSISSGLLMLIRGEYFIFVLFSLVYLYFKNKQITKVLTISALILLIISPYLIRNFNIFNVITITKSSGYNLLKGNHPNTKVEGTPMFLSVGKVVPEVNEKLQKLIENGPNVKYDLIQDQILLDQAIEFIKENPKKYFLLYFKKFFSFMFLDINSSYPNYYSPFHIIPKLFLSITTLLGLVLSFKFKLNIINYVALFYIANLGLFSFFFILPRYSLSLLLIQVILSLFLLKKYKPNL